MTELSEGTSHEEHDTRGLTKVTVTCRKISDMEDCDFNCAHWSIKFIHDFKYDEDVGVAGVFCRLYTGRNIFLTGPAACGKTSLLLQMMSGMDKYWAFKDANWIVMASSESSAAFRTWHHRCRSSAYLGIDINTSDQEPEDIVQNMPAIIKSRWRNLRTIIVDDVSTLSAEILELMEAIARSLRRRKDMFGGIQLIFAGDFCQLPPSSPGARWAFDSYFWYDLFPEVFYMLGPGPMDGHLSQNHVLGKLRTGQMTPYVEQVLRELKHERRSSKKQRSISLTPSREDAAVKNNLRLDQSEQEELLFHSVDRSADGTIIQPRLLLADCIMPGTLGLKKYAPVMMLTNKQFDWGAGELGTIVGWATERHWTRLPYSSQHRDPFEDDSPPDSQDTRWPVVHLDTGRRCLAVAERYDVCTPHGIVTREQVPLVLAWALAVEDVKSRTLDFATIDLRLQWRPGQVYMAFTRLRYQLPRIIGYGRGTVVADQRVLDYYEEYHTSYEEERQRYDVDDYYVREEEYYDEEEEEEEEEGGEGELYYEYYY